MLFSLNHPDLLYRYTVSFPRLWCLRVCEALRHSTCSVSERSSQIAAGVPSHAVNTKHWQDLLFNWDIPHSAALDKHTQHFASCCLSHTHMHTHPLQKHTDKHANLHLQTCSYNIYAEMCTRFTLHQAVSFGGSVFVINNIKLISGGYAHQVKKKRSYLGATF